MCVLAGLKSLYASLKENGSQETRALLRGGSPRGVKPTHAVAFVLFMWPRYSGLVHISVAMQVLGDASRMPTRIEEECSAWPHAARMTRTNVRVWLKVREKLWNVCVGEGWG